MEVWSADILVKTTGGNYKGLIRKTPTDENGTLIYIYSNGDDGWIVGTYRDDEIAEIIQQALHSEGANGK